MLYYPLCQSGLFEELRYQLSSLISMLRTLAVYLRSYVHTLVMEGNFFGIISNAIIIVVVISMHAYMYSYQLAT